MLFLSCHVSIACVDISIYLTIHKKNLSPYPLCDVSKPFRTNFHNNAHQTHRLKSTYSSDEEKITLISLYHRKIFQTRHFHVGLVPGRSIYLCNYFIMIMPLMMMMMLIWLTSTISSPWLAADVWRPYKHVMCYCAWLMMMSLNRTWNYSTKTKCWTTQNTKKKL
jgi:hypothetical protein